MKPISDMSSEDYKQIMLEIAKKAIKEVLAEQATVRGSIQPDDCDMLKEFNRRFAKTAKLFGYEETKA